MSLETAFPITGCIPWLFAAVFLTAGLAACTAIVLPSTGILFAANWVETPCLILSSELARSAKSSVVKIEYEYEIGGRSIRSSRYSFLDLSTNTSLAWKRGVVARYQPGQPARCFVNPTEPTDAVLERGWVPDMWWGLLPLGITAVGFLVLVATIRSGASRRSAEDQDDRSTWESDDEDDPIEGTTGPTVLQSETTPVQVLIFVTIFTLVWNGILSVFVIDTVQNFVAKGFGGIDWFRTLFLIPFVVIGVGLLLFGLYSLLAVFNPRPTLIVSSASIPLGGELTVNWTLSSRPSTMRSLQILLKGAEKATYRRGTSTATDTSVFAEIEVALTHELLEMEEGTARVRIPQDAMHSFDAPNNRIAWTLEVRGEIPFWPDMQATFPLTVLPLPEDRLEAAVD